MTQAPHPPLPAKQAAASQRGRRFGRRAAAVLLVSALLHLWLLNWADGSLADIARDARQPKLVSARLVPIQPKAEPKPELPKPKPAPHPRALPKKPPPQRPPPEAPAEAAVAPPTAQSAQPVIASGDGAATAAQTAQPAQPAAASGGPLQVSLPPSAQLSYRLVRQEPKLENPYYGKSQTSWVAAGDKYSLRTEAGLSVPFGTLNVLTLTSEGDITGAGIAPRITTETRRGRAETATHFNRDKGIITFSASTASAPLPAGAQDQATVAMQLAGIGRADPSQFRQNREFEILVGESREATLFRFVVVGQEELETELGKFSAWHIVRPPRPGTYSSKLDLWFAPALDWYPVQIRNSEANGAVTTQSVLEILTAGPAPRR